jgi:hypothetical protein
MRLAAFRRPAVLATLVVLILAIAVAVVLHMASGSDGFR